MVRNLYLRISRGRYVFRRRIPRALRARFEKHEIVRSLSAATFRSAQREAREYATISDALFHMASSDPTLTSRQLEQLAEQYFAERVQGYEDRLRGRVLVDPRDFESEIRMADRALEGAQELIRINDTLAPREAADALLDEAGLAVPRSNKSYKDLCRLILRAEYAAQQVRRARLDGDFGTGPSDPLFVSATRGVSSIAAATSTKAAIAAPPAPVSASSPGTVPTLLSSGASPSLVGVAPTGSTAPSSSASAPHHTIPVATGGVSALTPSTPPVAGTSTAPPLKVSAPCLSSPATIPTLGELVDRHLSSKKSDWDRQTLKQNGTTLRLLREHLGDPLVSTITRKQISTFLEALKTLPAKWGQTTKYRGKPLPEMLTEAAKEAASVPKLSRKTLNRHASAVSGLFSWAKLHGDWEGVNPATGFVDKRNLFGSRDRRPWRPDELKTLFDSEIWRSRTAKRDHRFFIPLMGLFGGFTLEEACKLTAEEVRLDDGVWVFDIQPSAEGRLKDGARRRTLPMHPMLIDAGLVKHVEAIRKAGGGPLWPALGKSATDGKRSTLFSKWFSRHCAKCGLKPSRRPGEPLLDFHSLRKNVGDSVRAAGYSETVANDILGHEARTMSYRTYSTGPALKKLNEAVRDIRYEVDLSHLVLP